MMRCQVKTWLHGLQYTTRNPIILGTTAWQHHCRPPRHVWYTAVHVHLQNTWCSQVSRYSLCVWSNLRPGWNQKKSRRTPCRARKKTHSAIPAKIKQTQSQRPGPVQRHVFAERPKAFWKPWKLLSPVWMPTFHAFSNGGGVLTDIGRLAGKVFRIQRHVYLSDMRHRSAADDMKVWATDLACDLALRSTNASRKALKIFLSNYYWNGWVLAGSDIPNETDRKGGNLRLFDECTRWFDILLHPPSAYAPATILCGWCMPAHTWSHKYVKSERYATVGVHVPPRNIMSWVMWEKP